MKYAWIENGLIFIGDLAPEGVKAFEVPDHTLPQDLKVVEGQIVPKTEEEKAEEVREKVRKEILKLARSFVNRKLEGAGYYGLGDVKIYADMNYREAQELLAWYVHFEKKLWSFLEDLKGMKAEDVERLNLQELINSFGDYTTA